MDNKKIKKGVLYFVLLFTLSMVVLNGVSYLIGNGIMDWTSFKIISVCFIGGATMVLCIVLLIEWVEKNNSQ
jgi:hypothetical protein